MSVTFKYQGPRKNREGRELRLDIDPKTQLWLMRMCYGEGGRDCSRIKAAAMLWAMVNRWFLHPGQRHWGPFHKMIRKFSQPINPRWLRGGDKAKEYAGTRFASESRLRRREKICNLTLDKIPDTIKATVIEFCKGEVFIPDAVINLHKSRVSDWASLPSTPRKYPWGVDIGGDWFFENKELVDGKIYIDYFYGDDEETEEMPDISKCRGEGCGTKELCYRYIAEDNPEWQSYILPHPEECEYFEPLPICEEPLDEV